MLELSSEQLTSEDADKKSYTSSMTDAKADKRRFTYVR
jgi:hypothetical protein